jgi:ABC-type sugar transport system permease subunit
VAESEGVAVAAGFRRRQRGLTRARLLRLSSPYALILPVVVAVGAILGYPLYELVRLAFQHYGLFELIRHQGQSVGWANFSSVLHDSVFWHTLVRTVVFTVANVGLGSCSRRASCSCGRRPSSSPCRCGRG